MLLAEGADFENILMVIYNKKKMNPWISTVLNNEQVKEIINFVINHPTYSRRGKISEYKSYKTCEIIIGNSEIYNLLPIQVTQYQDSST